MTQITTHIHPSSLFSIFMTPKRKLNIFIFSFSEADVIIFSEARSFLYIYKSVPLCDCKNLCQNFQLIAKKKKNYLNGTTKELYSFLFSFSLCLQYVNHYSQSHSNFDFETNNDGNFHFNCWNLKYKSKINVFVIS